MNQSATYVFMNDDDQQVTTAPTLLVAVTVCGVTDKTTVVIYNGSTSGGDQVLQLVALTGTTATFAPASPIALSKGLGMAVTDAGYATAIYC